LRKAFSYGNYSYFHLLSGVDLPIKKIDYIYNFFERNYGTEFVSIFNEDLFKKINNVFTKSNTNLFEKIKKMAYRVSYYDFAVENRVSYRHLFLSHRRVGNSFMRKLIDFTDFFYISIQKVLGLGKRIPFEIKRGDNWFSITDQFAKYLLDHEHAFYPLFKDGLCVDEVYVQTIIWNSPFRLKLCADSSEYRLTSCARCIDWERGEPYVFRNSDYDFLKNSPCNL